MDKNAIKKYAVWARRELIEKVSQKALQFGIEEGKELDLKLESINGVLLSDVEKKQRQALINKINEDGYNQVMEEVAYTWFNRFIAIRFMEVNGYLPSHVRVFTDENNAFKPQIMAEALHLDFENLDQEKIIMMRQENKDDDLYKYLLISQCNELSKILPLMFQKIMDYTELLLPDYLLREGSVIQQMIEMIPEEDWTDQVQIIGWMYQYYNTEQNELVYDGTLSKAHLSKELVPAATTIYTPDWAVRYMVDNSLGRLWMKSNRGENGVVREKAKYYLDKETDINTDNVGPDRDIQPEKIKCLDPCMGSGHILTYLFDFLIAIYEEYGYSARDAAALIINNNLYGLDIDDRAAQLSYFAVMMKGRFYDRRIFSKTITPHIFAIKESNGIDASVVDYFSNSKEDIKNDIKTIIDSYNDAKEYGSILDIPRVNFDALYERFEEIANELNLFSAMAMEQLYPIVQIADVMSQKYDVTITNPPYLGSNRFGKKLDNYVKSRFATVKSDLSMVMYKHALDKYTKVDGYVAFITTTSWMFLSSFENLREEVFSNYSIDTLVDFGTELFEGKVGHNSIVAWVTKRTNENAKTLGVKLSNYCYSLRDRKEPEFFNKDNYYYVYREDFEKIPGKPVAYSVTHSAVKCFEDGVRVDSFAFPKQGMATADNNRFLRLWFEVDINKTNLQCKSHEEAEECAKKWFPYNKGGGFKKWYGNNQYLINWEHDGAELKAFKGSVIRSPQFYFQQGISWCKVTSGSFSMRYIPEGFLFDVAGCTLFTDAEKIKYVLGYMNSAANAYILSLISPTLNYEVGHVGSLPILFAEKSVQDEIVRLVEENIEISKAEWDSYEESWDFKRHPLIPDKYGDNILIADLYTRWDNLCEERFDKQKKNEETINKLFLEIYGFTDLDGAVEDRNVTLRKADVKEDIKRLISYAVGCMFGRYSLDMPGIVYAGGKWNDECYKSFAADKDNIIPVTDDDYFSDDIVNRFIDFIKYVYGEKTLEDNLSYIVEAIGYTGQSRSALREYFNTEFYADHCSMYSVMGSGKRPIYWMFDSGKKNGFKCLIYMHRYQQDTIARVRTDYVHEQQARYRTAIEETENRIGQASGSDKVKLSKKLDSLKAQDDEIHGYEEKIHHLADQMISIDLDDGVKGNYELFKDVLAKLK